MRTPPTPRTKLPTIVRTRHSWLPVCTVFCHAHAVPAPVCAFRDHQVFGTIVYGTVHIAAAAVAAAALAAAALAAAALATTLAARATPRSMPGPRLWRR